MNETELDQLLDSWAAPAPPLSLREGLRERFPRVERRRFFRPLGWALAVVVALVTLSIGMGQSSEGGWDSRLVNILNQLYEHFLDGIKAWQSIGIVRQVRESDPKVYVDGLVAAPLEYGPGASMKVQVPGDGEYVIMTYPMPSHQADGVPTGWVEAGHIHANVIEFQAGSKQVRIECNKPIVDSDRPVFALRRP